MSQANTEEELKAELKRVEEAIKMRNRQTDELLKQVSLSNANLVRVLKSLE